MRIFCTFSHIPINMQIFTSSLLIIIRISLKLHWYLIIWIHTYYRANFITPILLQYFLTPCNHFLNFTLQKAVCGCGCLCCVCNLQWRMCMDVHMCGIWCRKFHIRSSLLTYICARRLVIRRMLLSFVFCLLSCLSVCLSVYHPRGVGAIKDVHVELIFWKAMGGHRAEPHTHTHPHDMHRCIIQ